MKRYGLIFVSLLFITNITLAQSSEKHHMPQQMHHAEQDTLQQMMHSRMGTMPGSQFVSRIGSGTGWVPDASPAYGYMFDTDKWTFMVHGNIFATYNIQDVANEGTRGDAMFYSVNWLMGMGQTQVGDNGLFRFNIMLSLEPLTVGGAGYPLLFQSGETWQGEPLVDRQHPHDLISALSVFYLYEISDAVNVFAYFGYPGEPALGPVAFMHRPSGLVNPNTPIGHHWQDATHVTWGVATVGFTYKNFKLDASIFTGTEPDENRFNFDNPRFNSYSIRLSYNLSDNWSFQVSRGWLYDVHNTGPREDLIRTTASAIYSARLADEIFLNATAVWGYNNPTRGHHTLSSHSFLLESALTLNNTTLYGRYEFVEKSTEDLLLDEDIFGHQLFGVNAFTLGLQQKIVSMWNTNIALGTQATLYITPDELEDIYGTNPWGLQFYLRIYPGLMKD